MRARITSTMVANSTTATGTDRPLCTAPTASRAKDDYRARERSRVLGVAESKTAPHEADLGRPRRIVMPPRRVRACGDKADDERSLETRPVRLPHPRFDLATVRRVHPAPLRAPGLREAVAVAVEVVPALRVRLRGAHIAREVELGVEFVEERLRRRPVIRCATEVDREPRLIATRRPRTRGDTHSSLPAPAVPADKPDDREHDQRGQ